MFIIFLKSPSHYYEGDSTKDSVQNSHHNLQGIYYKFIVMKDTFKNYLSNI